jgi:hypothetical protein
VDLVAGPEDVLAHLGIPVAGLVPEVRARLQQVAHAYLGHKTPVCLSGWDSRTPRLQTPPKPACDGTLHAGCGMCRRRCAAATPRRRALYHRSARSSAAGMADAGRERKAALRYSTCASRDCAADAPGQRAATRPPSPSDNGSGDSAIAGKIGPATVQAAWQKPCSAVRIQILFPGITWKTRETRMAVSIKSEEELRACAWPAPWRRRCWK